jgi:catechol 2,3-dioxygenase
MNKFVLEKNVQLKTVAIRVKEVGKMVDFYKQVVGLVLKSEENNLSIFGTQEAGSQLLILEETRSAESYHGETKQMALFSIKVPTKEEFLKIAKRISENQYPIDESKQYGSVYSIVVTDVEGNRFEIYYDPMNEKSFESQTSKNLDLTPLISESNEKHEGLAIGSFVSHIQLNVSRKEGLIDFYHNTLGFKQLAQQEIISVSDEKLFIGFQEVEPQAVANLPDPHIGLDFLSFKVESTSQIEQLASHLAELNLDYFVDKKKSILTVFDPIGIEWWFMIK